MQTRSGGRRTPGAGAGGFNRDVEAIVHSIRLLEIELEDATAAAKKSAQFAKKR